jgi:general secretion pathway protein G
MDTRKPHNPAMNLRSGSGFTLVEILIVVVILGILAAVVVPQFAGASETARTSSLKGSLQVIRSQLELYDSHHSAYPTLVQLGSSWNVLTQKTDAAGDPGTTYGPYLRNMPVNPFEDSATVAAAAGSGVGWVYDETTGRVYGVMATTTANEIGIDTVNTVRTY